MGSLSASLRTGVLTLTIPAVVGWMAACAHAPRPAPGDGGTARLDPTVAGDDEAGYHVVRPGDTLSEIAATYGVSMADLVRANDLADPDLIAVGQRILVPRLGSWSWPLAGGEILSRYGSRRSGRRHAGLDIRAREGQPVLASRAGWVVFSGRMRGYGRTVILDHGDGFRSLYAHNSELLVEEERRVRRGEPVARAGRSGNATTVHCHFEILRGDAAVDPLALLDTAS